MGHAAIANSPARCTRGVRVRVPPPTRTCTLWVPETGMARAIAGSRLVSDRVAGGAVASKFAIAVLG